MARLIPYFAIAYAVELWKESIVRLSRKGGEKVRMWGFRPAVWDFSRWGIANWASEPGVSKFDTCERRENKLEGHTLETK